MRLPEPPGTADAGHAAQLFDDHASLCRTVSAFLAEGCRQGETVLAVTTAAHWLSIEAGLIALGVPVAEAIAGEQLVVRDARRLLNLLRRCDRVDRVHFDLHIGRLVRTLAEYGRPIRIFGEIVDLLAGAGDFEGAEQLEGWWNELARRQSFALLCGYSASTFGDPLSRGMLQRICGAHAHVHTAPTDLLGTFLVEQALAR